MKENAFILSTIKTDIRGKQSDSEWLGWATKCIK